MSAAIPRRRRGWDEDEHRTFNIELPTSNEGEDGEEVKAEHSKFEVNVELSVTDKEERTRLSQTTLHQKRN